MAIPHKYYIPSSRIFTKDTDDLVINIEISKQNDTFLGQHYLYCDLPDYNHITIFEKQINNDNIQHINSSDPLYQKFTFTVNNIKTISQFLSYKNQNIHLYIVKNPQIRSYVDSIRIQDDPIVNTVSNIELNFNSQGGNPIVNEISYESNNRYIFSLQKIDEEALVKFTMISKSSKLALRLGELELEDTSSYSDDDINWKTGIKKKIQDDYNTVIIENIVPEENKKFYLLLESEYNDTVESQTVTITLEGILFSESIEEDNTIPIVINGASAPEIVNFSEVPQIALGFSTKYYRDLSIKPYSYVYSTTGMAIFFMYQQFYITIPNWDTSESSKYNINFSISDNSHQLDIYIINSETYEVIGDTTSQLYPTSNKLITEISGTRFLKDTTYEIVVVPKIDNIKYDQIFEWPSNILGPSINFNTAKPFSLELIFSQITS